MDAKYLEEIKARCEKATAGEWIAFEDEIVNSHENARGARYTPIVSHVKGRECWLKHEDAEFIAHSRTDVPELLAEVERLQKENQGWRANSMIQESVIQNGYDPADKDKIVKLILEKSAKDDKIATLKKALELESQSIIDAMHKLQEMGIFPHVEDSPVSEFVNHYIQQAQEQEEANKT